MLQGLSNHPFMQDVSGTAIMSFLLPQLTYIERKVYEIKYPVIRYNTGILPIDTSAPEWMPSVTYFSTDAVGEAHWFNSQGNDVPHVDVTRAKYEVTVKMASIGYQWNVEELAQAQMLGQPLATEKAAAARRIAEEFIDSRVLFGDASVGYVGLFNNSQVAIGQAGSNGASTPSTLWAFKTAAQILSDVNGVLSSIYSGTQTVEMADTLLIPITSWEQIVTTPYNNYSEKTILQYILEANIYTAETGRKLTIKSIRGLDTASATGGGRLMAYRNDPEVVKVHMPMPFRFLPMPWRSAPLAYHIPGIFRFAGTDIRLPGACSYLDGVC